MRPWLELIADSLDSQVEAANYDSAIFQRMIERMRRNTLSPEELSMIKDEAAWEEAKQNAINEGRTEGLAEGRRQEKLNIARTLLADGMEISLIAKVTGLTPTEIAQVHQA